MILVIYVIPILITFILLFCYILIRCELGVAGVYEGGTINSYNAIDTNKLAKEYARWEFTRRLRRYWRFERYELAFETFLMLMANQNDGKGKDPIFLDINKDSPPYMIFHELLSEEHAQSVIDYLYAKIAEWLYSVDGANANVGLVQVPKYYLIDNEFVCGDFKRYIAPEILMKFRNLANDREYSYIEVNEVILIMLLRYDNLFKFHTWNIPRTVYDVLWDAGFRIEAFAAPFDSQMLLRGGQYCSLFPDTDSIFGSLGRIQDVDTAKFAQGVVFAPPKIAALYDMARTKFDKCKIAIFFEIGNSIVGKDSTCFNADDTFTWYLETTNVTHQPTAFEYLGPGDICIHARGFNYDKLAPKLKDAFTIKYDTGDPEYIALIDKLKREYSRWVYVEKIKGIISANSANKKHEYEWFNILERFLMSMANVVGDSSDYIFKRKHTNLIYDKMEQELAEKHIASKTRAGAICGEVREIIENWFALNLSKITMIWHQNRAGFGCRNANDESWAPFVYKLEIMRHYRFRDIIRLNGFYKYENLLILIMLIRYASVFARGQHWNIPQAWYTELYDKYGVRTECFASPLNSQLLMIGHDIKFCSMFYDTDYYFGSLGSIYDFDVYARWKALGGAAVSITACPPYVPSILDSMTGLFDSWFDIAREYDIKLRIFTGLPLWKDATFYSEMLSSKYLKFSRELTGNDYYYENSLDETVPRIVTRSSWVTIVLANYDDPGANYQGLSARLNLVEDIYAANLDKKN